MSCGMLRLVRSPVLARQWRTLGAQKGLKTHSTRGVRLLHSSNAVKSSLSSILKFGSEVESARLQQKPIVALESTIITHGLPYPNNLKMAREVEQVIRKEGAIPATTAFVDGVPHVGLEGNDLERLANQKDAVKISRRDVPHVMAQGLSGGTTIAGTMILAHAAGIKVFATGGLGGVHRNGENTMDVSADLDELARTPVAVVCSGPKSILDIGRTMEYLETKGVYVSTHGPKGTNIPGFFTSDSGVPSPYTFEDAKFAAKAVFWNHVMELDSGMVFCIPTPKHLSLPREKTEAVIQDALKKAEQQNITGKEVTPFLLREIWNLTGGQSLNTNVGFVKNNARLAAQMAVELSFLDKAGPKTISKGSLRAIPPTFGNKRSFHSSASAMGKRKRKKRLAKEITEDEFKLFKMYPPPKADPNLLEGMVIGGIAVDMTCKLDDKGQPVAHTSTPGSISTSIGGVAHNIAMAAAYIGASRKIKLRLVTQLGKGGQAVIDELNANPHAYDTSAIAVDETKRTARYVSMHNSKGELEVACADMEDLKTMPIEHIQKEIDRGDPMVVFFDGNLSPEQANFVVDYMNKMPVVDDRPEQERVIGFEPTSVEKAKLLGELDLKVFPRTSLRLSTPTLSELESMYEAMKAKGRFEEDDFKHYLRQLEMDDSFADPFQAFAGASGILDLITSDVLKQCVALSAFIPYLFVKLGKHGVMTVQVVSNIKKARAFLHAPLKTISGDKIRHVMHTRPGPRPFTIVFQHFPAERVQPERIVNESGCGDTFAGAILGETSRERNWMKNVAKRKKAVMNRCQLAAAYTLQSEQSVSPMLVEMTKRTHRTVKSADFSRHHPGAVNKRHHMGLGAGEKIQAMAIHALREKKSPGEMAGFELEEDEYQPEEELEQE